MDKKSVAIELVKVAKSLLSKTGIRFGMKHGYGIAECIVIVEDGYDLKIADKLLSKKLFDTEDIGLSAPDKNWSNKGDGRMEKKFRFDEVTPKQVEQLKNIWLEK